MLTLPEEILLLLLDDDGALREPGHGLALAPAGRWRRPAQPVLRARGRGADGAGPALQEGGKLAACSPRGEVRDVLKMTGFDSFVAVHPDREAALATAG